MKIPFEWIPPNYWEGSLTLGKLEKLYYHTDDYFQKGQKVRKHAWIYLPTGFEYGRDYPVLFFMHGAATNLDEWIYPAGHPFAFCNVLDCMMENGEIPSTIIVFPTYYQGDYQAFNCNKETDIALAEWFPKELNQDLIPAVENAYIDMHLKDGKPNRRKKHLFTGFSMGGVITWNVFIECRDNISVFCPFSGDCWQAGWMGGSRKTEETADLLAESVKRQKMDKDDFFIYAMTGENDLARKAMSIQVDMMKGYSDIFNDSNLVFQVMEKGEHNYDFCFIYMYHTLKYLHDNKLL